MSNSLCKSCLKISLSDIQVECLSYEKSIERKAFGWDFGKYGVAKFSKINNAHVGQTLWEISL